jgi:serine/threonine protein kinase/outer membrane protein assembly factor BamB
MCGIVQIKAGTRLGPYAIEHLLGVGGMGEVYRARDTRLDRLVALKVLPETLAADAAHLVRFQREAKTISALNHPHICALHDVGQHEATHFLVLELLEGETLAARIARGPCPPSQVERVGAQIADALAAAHRHGLVHRDLKPANIMVTATGVKLLDFGLAKAMATPVAISAVPATIVGDGPATAEGQIVGTLQYMAPEQVQGLATDARTDIFALGAVLYEMLTGRKAFEAPTPAGLIGRILQSDPPAIASLAPGTPEALAALVERCLAKDPQDRWQSAHDVRLQLEWLQARSGEASAATVSPGGTFRRWRVPLATALAGAILGATPFMLSSPQVPETQTGLPPRRFDITLPEGTILQDRIVADTPEISPDGRWIVYPHGIIGSRRLTLLDLTTQESRMLVDREDVSFPFWSPDSKSVGYFAGGTLKTVPVWGGEPRVLARTPIPLGGSWRSGRIMFGSATNAKDLRALQGSALYTVGEAGGTPTTVEGLAPLERNNVYVVPRLLDDGTTFLLHTYPESSIRIAALDTSKVRVLWDRPGSWGSVASNHLVTVRDGRVFATPFDERAGRLTGPEMFLADGARSASVSAEGTVVLHKALAGGDRSPTWFDRNGARTGTPAEPAPYQGMTLSRDGRRAMTWLVQADNTDVWGLDVSTGVLTRMSSDPAIESDAQWSPDGDRIAFTSGRSGRYAVYVRDVATGRESLVASLPDRAIVLDGWTPDGGALIVRASLVAPRRVFLAPANGTGLRQIMESEFIIDESQVSPDGRWIAFNSDETGAWEVYVARFPDFTSRRRVSSSGGVQPKWRGDGKELFYLAMDSSMMSVSLSTAPDLTAQRPVKLFATNIEPSAMLTQYGVTPDGQRFLGLDRGEPQREVFTVLLNWLTPENLARHARP